MEDSKKYLRSLVSDASMYQGSNILTIVSGCNSLKVDAVSYASISGDTMTGDLALYNCCSDATICATAFKADVSMYNTNAQNIQYIHITDRDFYFMVENQVRNYLPNYEETIMLPKAETILSQNDIREEELLDYPVEGYYYKTNKLRRFLKIVRNIQENSAIYKRLKKTSELDEMIAYFSKELWGKVKSGRSAQVGLSDPLMPRRWDIVALTLADAELFDLKYTARPWTMDKVVENLSRHFTNTPNLVELAYLTGDRECLVAGAESNSLVRDFVHFYGSGCYIGPEPVIKYVWDVKPEVTDMGRRMIDEYKLIVGDSIILPTFDNHLRFNKNSERPRVSHLGTNAIVKEFYFWLVDENGRVSDFYSPDFVTTESYMKSHGWHSQNEQNPSLTRGIYTNLNQINKGE